MKKVLFLLITIFLLDCTKDDSSPVKETDINLVTGIHLTNTGFNVEMQLGNPNVFADSFVVYPNHY